VSLEAPWGYDSWTHTEVVPKPPPITWSWTIGPVRVKTTQPTPRVGPTSTPTESDITVQLTADQQVTLTISGEDAYDNPVEIDPSLAVWTSSDEGIVQVQPQTGTASAIAVAVGPTGAAAVTVSNADQTVSGSIAIEVVAGQVTEVVVTAGTPEDKPVAPSRGQR